MHVNKPLPASYNSPSNSQFKDSVEESDGRRQSYFYSFAFFLFEFYFSYFRLILGQAACKYMQLPCDFLHVFKVSSHLSNGVTLSPIILSLYSHKVSLPHPSLSHLQCHVPRGNIPQVHVYKAHQVFTSSRLFVIKVLRILRVLHICLLSDHILSCVLLTTLSSLFFSLVDDQ